jgi:hypothetical protein
VRGRPAARHGASARRLGPGTTQAEGLQMKAPRRRIAGLIALSSGMLLADGCDGVDQVRAATAAALCIARNWL